MKRLKKIITSCAISSLLFSVVIGCSSSPAASGTNVKPADPQNAVNTNLTSSGFPIVKEKTTLRILTVGDPSINYETNEFTKWYEEQTNIHIEWDVVLSNNPIEQLNLKLASGQYPDVIMGFPITPTQMMIYGKQGVFLPLNDMIEKSGVEIKKAFVDTPKAKEVSTAPDGKIYGLPRINVCYHCAYSQKMWIYEPWLKKLGLSMPTTTDEFYKVLKAFKEKDPNGNGKPDEIPLASRTGTGNTNIVPFIMNSFIYTSYFNESTKGMLIKDGKIDVAYNKPEWKEGILYFKKLFDEKLLAPETFIQSADQLKAMGENPDAPILGAAPGITPGFVQWLGPSGRWEGYKTVPALQGPKGVRLAGWDAYSIGNVGYYIITNKSKQPDVAFRWADAFYSRDVTNRSSMGRPGIEWREALPGEIGLDGGPANYSFIDDGKNAHWFTHGLVNKTNAYRMGRVTNPKNPLEDMLYKESKDNYEAYKPDVNIIVPPLFFNNEQAAEVANIQKTINEYVDQMFARFVTGDADINKDWDGYVKTLDGMNLKRLLAIYQEAYLVSKK